MLNLHNIKPAKGATKKRKRIGRGSGSGHGTYSTRGIKGQKSRSGVTGLKKLGMKKMLASIPKMRGFKSLKAKNIIIDLSEINNVYKDGEKVSKETLLKNKLILDLKGTIKILGNGELKIKTLEVSGIKVSKSVKEQIEKLGGKIN